MNATKTSNQSVVSKKRQKRRRRLTKQQVMILKRRRKREKIKRRLREFSLVLAIVLLILSIVGHYFFSAITLADYDMAPNLMQGDRLLVRKNQKISRFDVVLIKVSGENAQVRRIVGLPGESIRHEKDTLYVNDRQAIERFLLEEVRSANENNLSYTAAFTLADFGLSDTIPENYYFVLGDNRGFAVDSRNYGFVSEKDIVGVVSFKWFPLHALEFY